MTSAIHHIDCLEGLDTLESELVHTVVTSPPYFGLRDYKIEPTAWPEVSYSIFGFPVVVPAQSCCLGLEKTPHEFIGHLVHIFRKVHRVLRKDGTLWLNIGDSYAGSWGNYGGENRGAGSQREIVNGSQVHNKAYSNQTFRPATSRVHNSRSSTLQGSTSSQDEQSLRAHESITTPGLKPKDLIGIPWMLAFALRDDGWYLRQDIIWSKPNPMPESVYDRCTKSHEYVFLLSKSRKYYYDHKAIMKDVELGTVLRLDQNVLEQNGSDRVPGKTNGKMKAVANADTRVKYAWGRAIDGSIDDVRKGEGYEIQKRKSGNKARVNGTDRDCPEDSGSNVASHVPWEGAKANKRSVWTVTTKPFKEAHFATFPQDLVVDMIKAGSSEHGCCSTCGAPYKRISEDKLVPGPKASFNSTEDARDQNADTQDQGSNRMKDGHKPGWVYETKTTGWAATCHCFPSVVVPTRVLDPFSGAGTTFIVARKLNRHCIAFEKKAEYVEMSIKRAQQELGLFL